MVEINKRRTNCACYCKDTHFEAIHNQSFDTLIASIIVLATAKIHILKQFTTTVASTQRCASIVLATAKIHILKQFTTVFQTLLGKLYCACYCKDTHFEAIHNIFVFMFFIVAIVLATAKIHILKQFTTGYFGGRVCRALCLLLQRYTF